MRKFKFNGYHDTPYYGDGVFTIGKVYEAENVDEVGNDAGFIDDNGDYMVEDLEYFTEVTDVEG